MALSKTVGESIQISKSWLGKHSKICHCSAITILPLKGKKQEEHTTFNTKYKCLLINCVVKTLQTMANFYIYADTKGHLLYEGFSKPSQKMYAIKKNCIGTSKISGLKHFPS